jgi:inhibitor of cysteine peptidase
MFSHASQTVKIPLTILGLVSLLSAPPLLHFARSWTVRAGVSQAADGDAAFDWSIAFTLPSSDFALRLSGNESGATALQRQITARLTDRGVHCQVLPEPTAGAFRVMLTGDGGARQLRQIVYADLQQHIRITGGAAHLSVRGVFDRGQTLELVLESNPSTGFLWEVEGASLPLFSSVEDVGYRPVEARVGAPAKQIVRLTAARPGEVTFGLSYRRPWEESQPVLWIRIQAQELPEILDLSNPLPPLPAASPSDTWGQRTASTGLVADRRADTDAAGWAGASLALPPSFDWRTLGKVTPVRDQRDCGSCWAFAVVGVIESAMLVYGEAARDLSEQYLVSCNVDGYSCSGGNMDAHSYHFNEEGQLSNPPGAVLEGDFPYIAADGSCSQ